MSSYLFDQGTYDTISELANAMGAHWTKGRQFLLNGKLRNELHSSDKALFNYITYLEKKYKADPKKENLLFLQWLVKIPGVKNLYWMGRNYGELNSIEASIKSSSNEDVRRLVLLMIQEQIFGDFVKNSGRAEQTVANVRYLERCYSKQDTKFHRSSILPLMSMVLSESKEFLYDGRTFINVQEFAVYLQNHANHSKERLSLKASGLFINDFNFKPEFEGWLLNLGYQKELSAWKDKYQAGTADDSFNDDIVLLEDVEEKKEAKVQSNKDFAKNVASFDVEFTEILEKYPNVILNDTRFNGMLKDVFPDKNLQIYLIHLLYKMDIVKAIKDANELNEMFTTRFINRLTKDFGIKEEFAKWAVSIWCVCYGEKILHKKNRVILKQIT